MQDYKPGDIARTACYALRQRKLLALHYQGDFRVVEVHKVGYSTFGRALAYVWEIRNDRTHVENSPWALLSLGDATSATIVDAGSQAPRPGYEWDKHGIRWLLLEV